MNLTQTQQFLSICFITTLSQATETNKSVSHCLKMAVVCFPNPTDRPFGTKITFLLLGLVPDLL